MSLLINFYAFTSQPPGPPPITPFINFTAKNPLNNGTIPTGGLNTIVTTAGQTFTLEGGATAGTIATNELNGFPVLSLSNTKYIVPAGIPNSIGQDLIVIVLFKRETSAAQSLSFFGYPDGTTRIADFNFNGTFYSDHGSIFNSGNRLLVTERVSTLSNYTISVYKVVGSAMERWQSGLRIGSKTGAVNVSVNSSTTGYMGYTGEAGKIAQLMVHVGNLTDAQIYQQINYLVNEWSLYFAPIDYVNTGLTSAYSLRKIRSAYAGAAIRVRRSSDNAEQDIGFDSSNNLDTASLLSFVGSDTGYIRTWYDQSTSANHINQTTTANMPIIFDAGTLVVCNNKPAITNVNATRFLTSANSVGNTNSAFFVVGQQNTNSEKNLITNVAGTTYYATLQKSGVSNNVELYAGTSATASSVSVPVGSQMIFSGAINGTSSFYRINGTQSANINAGTGGPGAFKIGGLTSLDFYQEIYVFTQVRSVDEYMFFENNAAKYWGVY